MQFWFVGAYSAIHYWWEVCGPQLWVGHSRQVLYLFQPGVPKHSLPGISLHFFLGLGFLRPCWSINSKSKPVSGQGYGFLILKGSFFFFFLFQDWNSEMDKFSFHFFSFVRGFYFLIHEFWIYPILYLVEAQSLAFCPLHSFEIQVSRFLGLANVPRAVMIFVHFDHSGFLLCGVISPQHAPPPPFLSMSWTYNCVFKWIFAIFYLLFYSLCVLQ